MEKEIKITFKTITPLWTGDAWGDNTKIRPSSIMGSLRFWFEVYCKSTGIDNTGKLNNDGIPADNINDYIKEYGKRNNDSTLSLNSLIKQEMFNEDYETSLKNVLEKIKLPLVSKIFGCTNWKSQIKVKEMKYKNYILNKADIDFNFLLDKFQKDSSFWINHLLFKEESKLTLFEDVTAKLQISTIISEDIKRFLKFYVDKIIICGGKKSFGFGFCTIETDLDLDDVKAPPIKSRFYDVREINEGIKDNAKRDKIILGFNFKYYQRLKEQWRFRTRNFGGKGKDKSSASNFFFSTKMLNTDEIYLIGFKNGLKDELFNKLLDKYSSFNDTNSMN